MVSLFVESLYPHGKFIICSAPACTNTILIMAFKDDKFLT